MAMHLNNVVETFVKLPQEKNSKQLYSCTYMHICMCVYARTETHTVS